MGSRSDKRGLIATIGLMAGILLQLLSSQAPAAETLNVYSIWPENYARPVLEAFEKASGIKVKFIRFSSGEALARLIAEKNNPRVDVLFGGPVETFAAGIKEIGEAKKVAVSAAESSTPLAITRISAGTTVR